MPLIIPIRDLRKTSEISNMAHQEHEPIFITKNGYSDLVVMSVEYYEQFTNINSVDQAIYESEKEIANGGIVKDASEVFADLERKYFG